MKSARNQLILLGMICQALSWDGYLLLFATVALWVLCLKIHDRSPVLLSQAAEGSLLLLGCAIGFGIGFIPGQSSHFFIGHGITFFQLGRLLRGLDHREKVYSVLAAAVQIGVACTVVLDYRFIPILMAALILIPRALMEIEAGFFPVTTYTTVPRLRWPTVLVTLAVTGLFFLCFPRGLLSSAFGGFRPPGADRGSLLDNVLDPSRAGQLGSNRIILQIEGQNIGYLRSFAMVDFVDGRWKVDEWPGSIPIAQVGPSKRGEYLYRRVRVKDTRFLGRTLPTDGIVGALEGKFFLGARRTYHEHIVCRELWNTANNVYEYWTFNRPVPTDLGWRWRRRCREHPGQPPELQQWLDEQLEGIDNPLDQARHLETHLRDTFTYELGGPELSRVSPTADFILRERRGHCERFASSLALLLRMKDIPTRVMVGYVPTPPNWLSGWQNVRPRDAHAWTEAWFEDLGWIQLDATPRAEIALSSSRFRDLLDALDVAWYVNIVNLDAATQQGIFTGSVEALARLPGWAARHAVPLSVFLAVPAFWLLFRLWYRQGGPRRAKSDPDRRKESVVLAEHYYGRMLRLLAQQGIHRPAHLTPNEFLEVLGDKPTPGLGEIRTITHLFCASRYGPLLLSEDHRLQIENSLRRLSHARSQ